MLFFELLLHLLSEGDDLMSQSFEKKLCERLMISYKYFNDNQDVFLSFLGPGLEQVGQSLTQYLQLVSLLLPINMKGALTVGLVKQILINPIG